MDKLLDVAVVLAGVALIGWGTYEIYAPAAKVVVGLIFLGFVIMSRSGK